MNAVHMRKKKFTTLVGVVNFFLILCKMYPLYLSNFNNFRGSNVQLSRDGSVKNIYSLSVEKKNEQTARGLLTGL